MFCYNTLARKNFSPNINNWCIVIWNIKVNTRTEFDHFKPFPLVQFISNFGSAYNTLCYKTGNLHHDEVTFGAFQKIYTTFIML